VLRKGIAFDMIVNTTLYTVMKENNAFVCGYFVICCNIVEINPVELGGI